MLDLSTILGVGKIATGLFGGGSKTSGSSSTSASGTQRGMTQSFSDEVLASLDKTLLEALNSGGLTEGQNALRSRLGQLSTAAQEPAFDVESFTQGITDQATAAAGLDLDDQINSMISAVGGSETGNSMVALLGNKLRNTTAANLAGISAQARGTGEQIKTTQQSALTNDIAAMSNSLATQILGLIGQVKGGRVAEQVETQQTTNTTSQQTTREDPWKNLFSLFSNSAAAA